nr:universal stress protein [Sphaerotilus sp. FB-5]
MIASRARAAAHPTPAAAATPTVGRANRVLLPVDGSEGALAAVRQVIAMHDGHPQPGSFRVDLLNVQHSVPGDVSTFVAGATLQDYHHERSAEDMAAARALLDAAKVPYTVHTRVGDAPAVIADTARELGSEQIVMGSRGLGAIAGALMGSVTTETLRLSPVEVVIAKG